jgi:peptidoglycan hydrolase-like protein with peptidoglycan-binding domain
VGDNEPDLSSPLPWRRSLRAAQARRSAQARRRRLLLRGRAGVTLAVAGLTVAAGGALAQDPTGGSSGQDTGERTASVSTSSASGVRAVQRALGLSADGVYGKRTRAAVRRFQRRNDLTVDGIVGPQTLRALGLSSGDTGEDAGSDNGDSAAPGGDAGTVDAEKAAKPSDPTLERIAQCESGGDPTAVSSDGRYRGKYQFDRETWARMGGSGDPATAPESEQDRLAAKLLAQSGTAPWPACGR